MRKRDCYRLKFREVYERTKTKNLKIQVNNLMTLDDNAGDDSPRIDEMKTMDFRLPKKKIIRYFPPKNKSMMPLPSYTPKSHRLVSNDSLLQKAATPNNTKGGNIVEVKSIKHY